MSKQQNSSLVRLKILKNVGRWTEGEEIEVSEAQAQVLCEIRTRSNGDGLVKWQNAMRVSDIKKLAAMPPDMGGLSLDEARALGIKNIAVDPNGPGPMEPMRLRPNGDISAKKPEVAPTSNEASCSEIKSADEGASALQSIELNKNNPRNRNKAESA